MVFHTDYDIIVHRKFSCISNGRADGFTYWKRRGFGQADKDKVWCSVRWFDGFIFQGISLDVSFLNLSLIFDCCRTPILQHINECGRSWSRLDRRCLQPVILKALKELLREKVKFGWFYQTESITIFVRSLCRKLCIFDGIHIHWVRDRKELRINPSWKYARL